MRGKDVAYGLFCLGVLAALIWPIYPMFGGGIEPYVLGLPMSFAWNMIWIAVSFAGLLVYHVTEAH